MTVSMLNKHDTDYGTLRSVLLQYMYYKEPDPRRMEGRIKRPDQGPVLSENYTTSIFG